MADTPNPRSKNQIIGQMLSSFLSRYGLRNIRAGSPILSIFETAAQSDLRSSQDIFNLLSAQSLDRTEGEALVREGADEDLVIRTQRAAFGKVNFSDSSFEKISTKIYQGTPAPIVGSTEINVNDATDFPSSGDIYLGRYTGNYEGPLSYASPPVDNGSYWTITLSSPTLRFHNSGESIILAQGGNRLIGSGQVVSTPQGNNSDSVSYSVVYSTTILDGETSVSDVLVIAQEEGSVGNVIAGAISEFAGEPFSGAVVINPLPFTNGRDTESPSDFRDRIRQARQTKTKGTPLAIQTSVVDAESLEENKRVVSSSIVRNHDGSSTLYIDDGTGYEELTEEIALETVVDSALGGEQYFVLKASKPIAKAFVTTELSAPFSLATGSKLAVQVGGVLTEHTFDASQFRSISNASVYEIVASINANPLIGFSARIAGSASKVSIFAKTELNEDIEVIEADTNDANVYLAFPTNKVETVKLYKNDRLLSKDGTLATLYTNQFNTWSTFSGSKTVVISVDGTPEATYTIENQDFIDAGTFFSTVGKNTLNAWADVLNYKIPGITAKVVENAISITSNLGRSARSSVSITDGTLLSTNMITADSSNGSDNDYSLDRNVGQIKLNIPLVAGDKLTAGTIATRAFIESESLTTATLAEDGNMWFSNDGDAEIIDNGANAITSLNITANAIVHWGYRVRISSASSESIFSNVEEGDWAVLADSPFDESIRGAWKVCEADDNYIEIAKKSMSIGRTFHTMTELSDGRVLVTGGFVGNFNDTIDAAPRTNACEIYDPSTQLWTNVASMSINRSEHTATLLDTGAVLIVGGRTLEEDGTLTIVDSCEIYDPTSDTWTEATSIDSERYCHTATKLATGDVLVAGGIEDDSGNTTNTTYIYDPSGDTWTSAGTCSSRARHTAVLIDTTDVLLVGGQSNASTCLATCDRYDGTWNIVGSFTTARQAHQTVLLSNGDVLLIGGSSAAHGITPVNLSTCFVFDTGANTWSSGPTGLTARSYHTASRIATGTGFNDVVVAFGYGATATPFQVSIAGTGNWAVPASPIPALTPGVRSKSTSVSLENTMLVAGGEDTTYFYKYAAAELYTRETNAWSQPDPSLGDDISGEIKIVRSTDYLQKVTVPAGVNYTASSFVSELNSTLKGLSASVYRTAKIRVGTNTFAESGSIALVAQNEEAESLGLEAEDVINNLSGHLGSIESGNEGVGTPNFAICYSYGEIGESSLVVGMTNEVSLSDERIDLGLNIVGLTNNNDIYETSPIVYPLGKIRTSAIDGFTSPLTAIDDDNSIITTREVPYLPWMSWDRFYLASPFRFGSEDQLSVLIDGDTETKRFALNMYRSVRPTNTIFSIQNTFVDANNGDNTLALAFGTDFNFDDFAVYMQARVRSHPAVPTNSILWRYFRHGPEGNEARLRYVYPTSETQDLTITPDNVSTDFATININLGSGELRTGFSIAASNKIGVACTAKTSGIATMKFVVGFSIASASRTTNVTTLTLTLPAGITNHGFAINDDLYVTSSSGSFSAGIKTLTAVTATTVSYAETDADAGPIASIGTVSFGGFQASFAGAGIIVGDFFRLETGVGLSSNFLNQTMRISSLPAGNQTVVGAFDDYSPAVSGTVVWGAINSLDYLKIFENSSQTAEEIVDAVNVLDDSPITGVLVGDGTGTITTSSTEEAVDSTFYYYLADGVNYIKTTINAPTINDDYEFVFKHSIDVDSVFTNNDWTNEDIRLVPTTTKNVVDWMNSPAVSGLFSVTEIKASSQNKKVQIATDMPGTDGSVQVQGGAANSYSAIVEGTAVVVEDGNGCVATIQKDSAIGFIGSSWVSVDNTNKMPKTIITADTTLVSLGSDGYMVFDSGGDPVWSHSASNGVIRGAVLSVEKQGKFVCYSQYEYRLSDTIFAGIQEGDWVYIASAIEPSSETAVEYKQISSANTGTFRVVRVVYPDTVNSSAGAFWIENPNAIEETASECDVHFLLFDSIMPGDTIQINTNLWNSTNKGSWTVESTGVLKATSLVGDMEKLGPEVTVITTADHFFTVGTLLTLSPGEGNFPGGIVEVTATPTSNSFTYDIVETTNLFNTLNQTFTTLPFENQFALKLSTTDKTPVPVGAVGALSTEYPLVQVIEANPSRVIKEIITIGQNPEDGDFVDVKFNTLFGSTLISEAAGSVLTALDKLDFSNAVSIGTDGYSHNIGLIGEANKIVYGDYQDQVTYPGVAAAGATIYISGALIRRIQVSVQIRLRSGALRKNIEASVRSAIATVINQSETGKPIAIVDIADAAQAVNGVMAVSIITPEFNSSNDMISIQPNEKALVLDLNSDILIRFIG